MRLGDLLGLDHAAVRLAGVEGGALGVGVVGLLEQATDPGGVRGAGHYGVHADAGRCSADESRFPCPISSDAMEAPEQRSAA